MARLALNKSALQKERNQLRLYKKLLPSLDLKRRQLTLEQGRARAEFEATHSEVQRLAARTAEEIPMLAHREIDVSGLVRVGSLRIEQENVVGVRLPVLREVSCVRRDYSLLAKPHWVDAVVEHLERMAEQRARMEVAEQRVRKLDQAVRRTTQRVNLFDKILIPTAKKNIQRIQIFLGDGERAAVARSKIAKLRHQRPAEGAASTEAGA